MVSIDAPDLIRLFRPKSIDSALICGCPEHLAAEVSSHPHSTTHIRLLPFVWPLVVSTSHASKSKGNSRSDPVNYGGPLEPEVASKRMQKTHPPNPSTSVKGLSMSASLANMYRCNPNGSLLLHSDGTAVRLSPYRYASEASDLQVPTRPIMGWRL